MTYILAHGFQSSGFPGSNCKALRRRKVLSTTSQTSCTRSAGYREVPSSLAIGIDQDCGNGKIGVCSGGDVSASTGSFNHISMGGEGDDLYIRTFSSLRCIGAYLLY